MRSLADAHEKKQEADEAAAAAAAYLAPVTPPANFALPDFMREICWFLFQSELVSFSNEAISYWAKKKLCTKPLYPRYDVYCTV